MDRAIAGVLWHRSSGEVQAPGKMSCVQVLIFPGRLQLLERPPCFDALMLASVADQQHAVGRAKASQEFLHLVGACQARFIYEIEMLPFRCGIG